MTRILSLIITICALAAGAILVAGYFAPISYSGSVQFQQNVSVELLWQELIKIREIPNRKQDVESVDILEERGKLTAWKENLKNGGYRIYRTNRIVEGRLLVIELTESSYGLTGIWVFELQQKDDDTIITISEESKLTDMKRRGYRTFFGKNVDLLAWQKYVRSGTLQTLLLSP